MADNDIIDFYKKADNDSKPEEPLKEQVETPEPVVSEAVAAPVPESNDPFDKFLFNLAEKLKTEKKITEQQQLKFNERVVKPTTNPEDPFAKFLESFAGLVKEDENINKEDNIKEATIDFINKLKNDDFFDRDIPKIIPKVKSKSKKYLPPKFAKKIETVEEELPVIEQSTEPEAEVKQPKSSNPYLKELQTADKKKNKIEDKISGLSDIKKIIAQQVQEQLSKYPNIGFTGGGGGTNAVQYALGGTMDGDLNVTGKFLSGGVDISTLFGSGGGAVSGIPDRLIAGSETLRLYSNGTIDFPNDTIRPPDETILTLESENPLLSSYTRVALSPYAFFAYDNEGNSITFDEVDNAIVLTSRDLYEWTFNQQGVLAGPNGYLTVNALSSLGRILSGGKDLLEIFALSGTGGGEGSGRDDVNTVVIQNSATWIDTSTVVQNGSANWDTAYNTATVYQTNSASYATQNYVNTNFLALSGGTISGPVRIDNNLTINGNLTATGTTTFANTVFSVTSSLSVVHIGDGPALWVGNNGLGDIASFWDLDQNIEIFHVGGNNGTHPNVGVKTSTPNKDFTVNGEISATETIYANSYLSAGINLLDIFSGGGGGGGATPIKRFDYVTVSNIDYSYSGSALFGTLDTSPTWKLIRLTYANNGTISNSASALNSWTGRLTATYV